MKNLYITELGCKKSEKSGMKPKWLFLILCCVESASVQSFSSANVHPLSVVRYMDKKKGIFSDLIFSDFI